jgi:hypothetical protein
MTKARLDSIASEAEASKRLSNYQAVNGLWLCLVKLSNCVPTVGEEHEQMLSVLRKLSRDDATRICHNAGVDELLELKPALETVLADERERLQALQAQRELTRIRERRQRDPKAALTALFEIIQRIRDKREHAFKTPDGPRDGQILGAARKILTEMVLACLQQLKSAERRAETGSRVGG